MLNLRTILIVALVLAISGPAFGQRSKLSAGDAAPPLNVKTWVKGDAVTIESGNVYVVEFWATWCVPCRKAMPHLTELQKRHEEDGLIIVGISNEEKGTVERFVENQGEVMGYRVAVDDHSNTRRAYMDAAGLNSIPAAFIVDQRGRVQYIGHPGDSEFDRILEFVMEGRYDAKLFKQVQPMLKQIDSTRQMRNWRLTFSHIDQLLELDSHVFAPYALMKFEIMLVDMEDPDAAYEYGREVIETYKDDPNLLMNFAQKIAADPKLDAEDRNFDVALEATKVALRSARPDNPRTLSTQALVYFNAGNVEEAIALQRRAWMIAEPKNKPTYERVLRSYQDSRDREVRGSRGF